MAKLLPNCGDPDQTSLCAVSDLGLQCLPFTHSGSPDKSGSSKRFLVVCQTPFLVVVAISVCSGLPLTFLGSAD